MQRSFIFLFCLLSLLPALTGDESSSGPTKSRSPANDRFSAHFASVLNEHQPDQDLLLDMIGRHALFLSKANKALLNSLGECADWQVRKERGERANPPDFILKLQNISGETVGHARTCKDMLENYFGYHAQEPFTFRRSFRMMQIYAYLANSGQNVDVLDRSSLHMLKGLLSFETDPGKDIEQSLNQDLLNAESLDGDWSKKLHRYEHPVRTFIDKFSDGIGRMPKPHQVVWNAAFELYQKSIVDNCNDFVRQNRRRIAEHIHEDPLSPFFDNLCHHLPYKNLQGPGTPVLGHSDRVKLNRIRLGYLAHAKDRRAEFREKNLLLYKAAVMENPHYLLLNDWGPTSGDLKLNLAQIFVLIGKMKVNQEKSVRELRKMTDNGWIDYIKGYSKADLYPLYQSFPYSVNAYATGKLGWSSCRLARTEEELTSRHAAHVRFNNIEQMALSFGVTIAASAVCKKYVPAGKALGVTTSFLRGAIFAGIDAAFNGSFLWNSYLQRSRVFQQLASTPEMEYVIYSQGAESLSEENFNNLYNLAFMAVSLPSQASTAASVQRFKMYLREVAK